MSHHLLPTASAPASFNDQKHGPTLDDMNLPAKPRILAVEDNSETQLLLKHLLQSEFDVVVAAGVDEAVHAADQASQKGSNFDVLLLDINLSEQRTGTDLLRLLRERDDMQNVPAIALTAYAMPGDREDFLASGFNHYISKPFTRSDLTEAIESSLQAAD